MIPTVVQARILRALGKLRCLSLSQLTWLMHIEGRTKTRQTVKALKHLEMFHEVYLDFGAYHLPGRQVDGEIVRAVWVMRKVAGNELPEYALGKPPFKLCFRIGDAFYRVISAPYGEEAAAQAMAEQASSPGDNLFFLLRSQEQIPLLHPSKNTYLVLPDREQVCVFLQPKAR